MIKKLLFVIFISINTIAVKADSGESSSDSAKITVHAVRISEPIKIDGILSEPAWQKAVGTDHFIQREPKENTPPSEKTVVYILYDNDALYVGARMYDTSPDSIMARLTRRDGNVTSDVFGVFLDPYHDLRSGYYFGLNAAGTQLDGTMYNDNWNDNSWDGVWQGKVNIDDKGWTVEMRIPYSQLRFEVKKENIWGIDFERDIARYNEKDYLVYIPKNENGFVSRFAELKGLNDIQPHADFELLPYVTTKASYTAPEVGNPFNNGSAYKPGFGGDLKMGIGTNFTLNATINPDFGQVEIDPAVINLSDNETFYQEKRPFFVDNASTFKFGQGGVSNYWSFNWWTPQFFYSRRIGRNPQGEVPDADYTDVPSGTHILGAAKLTGKVDGNINVGVIQALTSRENAQYQIGGVKNSVEVEPLTYYGIFRAQKEINQGRQGLGFISTVTNRFFKDPALRDQINGGSYVGGIDGWTILDKSKTWAVSGWAGLSYIKGDKQRMVDVQTSSRHYFQRPDSKALHVDSSATSLSGYAARFVLAKQKGNFFVNSAFGIISPGFDINDLGFLPVSNRINMHIGAGYNWTEPTKYFRYLELGGALFRNYNYDGNINWEGAFHFGTLRLLNYIQFNWNLAYNPQTVNDGRTRGGPLSINPPGYQTGLYVNSDSRKSFVASGGFNTYDSKATHQWNVNAGVEFRPASNFTISIEPSFSKDFENSQYIDTFDDSYAKATFGKRYVFAEMHQTTFAAGVRLNWTFTPKLSLQVYMQPLISSGDFTNYKELAIPRTYDFNVYGENGSTLDKNNLTVDPDGSGPAAAFQIDDPNFNFISLRGNAVLRWEYMPGSVLFLVWTQTRADDDGIGNFRFNHSINRMLTLHPDNIFLLKFTYWLNM